jgi:2',3'-cyclic-nucleotide 2'-phosphodiesterase/3'-nucleotidase/5'-nucleotidase
VAKSVVSGGWGVLLGLAGVVVFTSTVGAEPAVLRQLDSHVAGPFDASAAEIPAVCTHTHRVFVVNARAAQIDVLTVNADGELIPDGHIELSAAGGGSANVPNSVAVSGGTLAVAVEAETRTAPGAVALYDTSTLELQQTIPAGALPDMVTFSPDGRWLLVANEGEPSEDATVDPEGTVTIIDLAAGLNAAAVQTVTFRDWNANGSRAAELPGLMDRGLRVSGSVNLDAAGKQSRPATFAEDVEPEWIAISPDSRLAYVCLQEANAVAEVDIAAAVVQRIIPLGFKDHGQPGMGLDVSDRDGQIAIEPRPNLYGVYQPDAIRLFSQGDRLLLVTANEGDSRVRPTEDGAVAGVAEGDFFNDEASLDEWPVEGSLFAEHASEDQLGRLKLVRDLVDRHLDADGRPTKLFCFGGRSFSIFDLATGDRVFDSGDSFERVTAERFPTFFNVSNDSLKREKRSRSKGPEPEALVLGTIDGRTYAFIGLERIGGIMVYDITEPEAAQYVGYCTSRNFEVKPTLPDGSANPAAGDSGPEGLVFVSADCSPTGTNLLIAGNETSGTTTVWEVVVGNASAGAAEAELSP